MDPKVRDWDYLILTASNDAQATAYESQLRTRCTLGLLSGVANVLVVADPGGKRVGSGGSTIYCLIRVLTQELAGSSELADPAAWDETLGDLRILIVHAGGDSKRLPAYGPCGKAFVPVPGETDTAVGATLFDRQLPTYLALPPREDGPGQVVITSGDVLLRFDPAEVRFAGEGIIGLGCNAPPEEAARQGVYCASPDGTVVRFLQKPSVDEQRREDAISRYGQSILDVGVLSLDPDSAVRLLRMCDVSPDGEGELTWSGGTGQAIEEHGLDFYREICCAMGTMGSEEHHIRASRGSKSTWPEELLRELYRHLSPIPFHVQVLPQCGFLHFGMTRQLITSGTHLTRLDHGLTQLEAPLEINTELTDGGSVAGTSSWIEGCMVHSTLTLEGNNVVVGVDVDQPLSLPPGACLDVLRGQDRRGESVWFVRCYGIDDKFKDCAAEGATLCGLPLSGWPEALGIEPEEVWDGDTPPTQRTVWDARVFPAETDAGGFRKWLWMFDPAGATPAERSAWRSADRYSLAQIAVLADQETFHDRRARIRAGEIRRSMHRAFCNDSGFSGSELAYVLARTDNRAAWVADLLAEAHWYAGGDRGTTAGQQGLIASRIIHTLGTAVEVLAQDGQTLTDTIPGLQAALPRSLNDWLQELELSPQENTDAASWTRRAKAVAFERLRQTILSSSRPAGSLPKGTLRSDEIIWGRAPARLDLGGGWADTPPYCLEHGGCVINAAVNLNGQPPIQAYARMIDQSLIRIGSIDLGARIEITELQELLDFDTATGEFALAKAALALSGLSPQSAPWPDGITLKDMLTQFGGGIELTTLAAVPKGSGLGTSSIVGAVILAVVQRLIGRDLTRKELFHGVLRLEQALTTGGGWQDQIGGAVDGVKVITSGPGLVPDPQIHYVPADVLDPRINDGQTLLYYTGITRLAKNILQQVVGRYLDRDRVTMDTLRRIHGLPPDVANAMARKNLPAFGRLIDSAWRLNKQLDPNSSNDEVEALLARVRPHIHGAKLLGAGGGGFLLLVCKSPSSASSVRDTLEKDPTNDRARFFDFDISGEGLVVTVC